MEDYKLTPSKINATADRVNLYFDAPVSQFHCTGDRVTDTQRRYVICEISPDRKRIGLQPFGVMVSEIGKDIYNEGYNYLLE